MINSMARSLITAKKWYRNMMAGNPQYSDMELISTVVITNTTTTSVSFNVSGLGSSYKHLQVRATHRDTSTSGGASGFWFWANSDVGTNYSWHRIKGGNNAVVSEWAATTTRILAGVGGRNGDSGNIFGAVIFDILDFASTTKYKTTRSLTGDVSSTSSSAEIEMTSGSWQSTSAMTAVNFVTDNYFVPGSRLSLYGIKG